MIVRPVPRRSPTLVVTAAPSSAPEPVANALTPPLVSPRHPLMGVVLAPQRSQDVSVSLVVDEDRAAT